RRAGGVRIRLWLGARPRRSAVFEIPGRLRGGVASADRRHGRGRRRGQAQGGVMRVEFFLLIGALLFTIGCAGVLIRRNAIVILMCIELMLNAVNLTFVAFALENQSMTGHIFVFFVMTVAAAEAAIGLAIVIALFRRRRTTDVEDASLMRW